MKKYGEDLLTLEDGDIRLPDRAAVTNKGDCGKLLVAGGDVGMVGAVSFAAEAAYRSGVGLVEVLTHPDNRIPVQTLIPEAIASFWGQWDHKRLGTYSAVTVGVGMGKGETARRLLDRILTSVKAPAVIDADALNIISDTPDLKGRLNANTVITPHIMEFSRLTGLSVAEIKQDTVSAAAAFAKDHGTNVVLKDKNTVTALADGTVLVNTTGDTTLSKGGSGDVLAGLIGSLLAQGLPIEQAVPYGVHLHGRAGERAGRRLGVRGALARDVIAELALVIKDF